MCNEVLYGYVIYTNSKQPSQDHSVVEMQSKPRSDSKASVFFPYPSLLEDKGHIWSSLVLPFSANRRWSVSAY